MPRSDNTPLHIEESIEIDHLDDEPFYNIPEVLRSPVQSRVVSTQPRLLAASESGEHFTPSLNTVKARTHNTGFNPIRLDSVQPISHKYKSTTNSRLCTLLSQVPIKGEPAASDHSNHSNTELKRTRSMSLTNIPDHAEVAEVKKRRVHDHSKGPSMTPSAIDYRERKKIAAEYQVRFAELLDDDIVQGVEAEGWLTPIGRLFKAGVRQLERQIEERRTKSQAMTSHAPNTQLIDDFSYDESATLRIENDRLKTKLDRLKQLMED